MTSLPLEELVTCPSCHDVYKNPLLLNNCLHTVCDACVKYNPNQPNAPKGIRCPVCRKEVVDIVRDYSKQALVKLYYQRNPLVAKPISSAMNAKKIVAPTQKTPKQTRKQLNLSMTPKSTRKQTSPMQSMDTMIGEILGLPKTPKSSRRAESVKISSPIPTRQPVSTKVANGSEIRTKADVLSNGYQSSESNTIGEILGLPKTPKSSRRDESVKINSPIPTRQPVSKKVANGSEIRTKADVLSNDYQSSESNTTSSSSLFSSEVQPQKLTSNLASFSSLSKEAEETIREEPEVSNKIPQECVENGVNDSSTTKDDGVDKTPELLQDENTNGTPDSAIDDSTDSGIDNAEDSPQSPQINPEGYELCKDPFATDDSNEDVTTKSDERRYSGGSFTRGIINTALSNDSISSCSASSDFGSVLLLHVCDMCRSETRKVDWKCLNCETLLCSGCKDAHNISPDNVNHQVKSTQDDIAVYTVEKDIVETHFTVDNEVTHSGLPLGDIIRDKRDVDYDDDEDDLSPVIEQDEEQFQMEDIKDEGVKYELKEVGNGFVRGFELKEDEVNNNETEVSSETSIVSDNLVDNEDIVKTTDLSVTMNGDIKNEMNGDISPSTKLSVNNVPRDDQKPGFDFKAVPEIILAGSLVVAALFSLGRGVKR